MKVTRQKKVQKYLNFYVNNYKFREPFQILIDGTFCFAALNGKFKIQEQLPKYFQAETKLLTTPCVIIETEKLAPETHGAILILKRFAVHKCSHEKNPITGSKCLRSMVGKDNSSRYIIATQDRELQDQIRKLSGVPLLYLHGKVPTLDPPSQGSKRKAEYLIQELRINNQQEKNLNTLKEKFGLIKEEEKKVRRKRKAGGPNPLSNKKKQKKPNSLEISKNCGKVRKRRKVKIPSHIKEVLKTSLK